MAGLIARLWAMVRSKELAGRDKTGNVFYRQSINVDGAVKERRWVDYKSDPDPKKLPVEWYSWLIGQRKEAPTQEEIMALEAHRKLVKMNAAIVKKEEEKRRFRSSSLQQDVLKDDIKAPDMNSFIKQISGLEGAKYDEGEKSFFPEASGGGALFEQSDSSNTAEKSSIQKPDDDMVAKRKERTDVYEKWIPPK